MFKAASLCTKLERWHDIGAPPFVIDWLEKGIRIFPPDVCIDQFHLNNHNLKPAEKDFLASEIRSLVKCGAIV